MRIIAVVFLAAFVAVNVYVAISNARLRAVIAKERVRVARLPRRKP